MLIRIGYAFRRAFFTNAKGTVENQEPGDQIQHERQNVSSIRFFLWELTQNHDLLLPRDFEALKQDLMENYTAYVASAGDQIQTKSGIRNHYQVKPSFEYCDRL